MTAVDVAHREATNEAAIATCLNDELIVTGTGGHGTIETLAAV